MSSLREQLPLLYEGDSYLLELSCEDDWSVRLHRVVRYENNQNVSGVEENFNDLDSFCKKAVITQIHRRYVGKTIKV